MRPTKPNLGFGLSLRTQHYSTILAEKPPVDWFEILTENYLVPGGKPLYFLDKIRELYPMVMHGVSMSLGSVDPIDWDYLQQVKALAKRIEPQWISDHLSWTGIHNKNTHDLLPLPYTETVMDHVVTRIQQIQDFLGQRILIENISSYITYQESTLHEWEFLNEVSERADCFILFDVNNLYVNSVNHGFDARTYIKALSAKRIYQIHLAGHSMQNNLLIDTHDNPIIEDVWDLYAETLRAIGPTSTMIEQDDPNTPLSDLLAELNQARKMADALNRISTA